MIRINIIMFGGIFAFENPVVGIFFKARHEENPSIIKGFQPCEVGIGFIEDRDIAFFQRDGRGYGQFVNITTGYDSKVWKMPSMAEFFSEIDLKPVA